MHLDVELALRWNLIEAATTSITLNVNNAQTVAGTIADTLEALEQTWFNLLLQLNGLFSQALFFLTSFSHDVLKLRAFLYQALLAVCLQVLSLVQVLHTLLHLLLTLANLLVAKFDFQLLELDFLTQSVILTVVAHGFELSLITLQASLSLSNLVLLLRHCAVELIDFVLDFLDASGETSNLIFQVLNLKRQLTSQGTLLVNSRQGGLKLVESLQLLFHCQICRIFLCHNCFLFFIFKFSFFITISHYYLLRNYDLFFP